MSWPELISRWAFGMALVSWRYLWQTTPLHRSDSVGGAGGPPSTPADLTATDLQPLEEGVGDMFHRRFSVEILEARLDARALIRSIVTDLGRHVPREVVQVRRPGAMDRPLRRNDDLVVDMPGPWNGPVRVVLADATHLRLATRRGHLEAGQIEFRAHDDGSRLVFEIETWARPSSRVVHLLYTRLRLAKEIQLNMWVRFCKAAVKTADGRMRDGIRIVTHRAPVDR